MSLLIYCAQLRSQNRQQEDHVESFPGYEFSSSTRNGRALSCWRRYIVFFTNRGWKRCSSYPRFFH